MTAAMSDGLTRVERSLAQAVLARSDEPRNETLEVLKHALSLDHVLPLDRHLVAIQNHIVADGMHTPLFQPVDDVLAAYMRLAYWSQPWATRYPLLTGLGYMGSIQGLVPVDHLFTRIGASPYMRATLQPESGDARAPNVLLNGTCGPRSGTLGVPPHAFADVIVLLRELIDGRDLSGEALARFLPGPDFPTGGLLVNNPDEIAAFYATGRGTLTLRGVSHAQPCTWQGAKEALVVTQLPYGVATGTWIDTLRVMMSNGELRGLIDIVERGDSDDGPVYLLLQPNRWRPEDIHLFLCRYTRFQCDIECEMRVLDHRGQETLCSLEDLVRGWLDSRLTQHGRGVVSAELDALFQAHGDPRRTLIDHSSPPIQKLLMRSTIPG